MTTAKKAVEPQDELAIIREAIDELKRRKDGNDRAKSTLKEKMDAHHRAGMPLYQQGAELDEEGDRITRELRRKEAELEALTPDPFRELRHGDRAALEDAIRSVTFARIGQYRLNGFPVDAPLPVLERIAAGLARAKSEDRPALLRLIEERAREAKVV